VFIYERNIHSWDEFIILHIIFHFVKITKKMRYLLSYVHMYILTYMYVYIFTYVQCFQLKEWIF